MSLLMSAPQPLSAHHWVVDFSCGEATLDDWLKRRALGNQFNGASRTFVVVDGDQRVQGYYAMAAGAVFQSEATGAVRRTMPDPIPVMVLARLAVNQPAQGLQLGAALLKDAVQRALTVSQNAGVRALLVHALSEKAKQFYLGYGFQESPVQPFTLMLKLPPGRSGDEG
jgi:GNAT superfamily N-acetyltransferase